MKRSDGNILEQSLIYANKPQNFYFIVHQQYWKDSDPNIFNYNKKLHSRKNYYLQCMEVLLVVVDRYNDNYSSVRMIFKRVPTNNFFQ